LTLCTPGSTARRWPNAPRSRTEERRRPAVWRGHSSGHLGHHDVAPHRRRPARSGRLRGRRARWPHGVCFDQAIQAVYVALQEMQECLAGERRRRNSLSQTVGLRLPRTPTMTTGQARAAHTPDRSSHGAPFVPRCAWHRPPGTGRRRRPRAGGYRCADPVLALEAHAGAASWAVASAALTIGRPCPRSPAGDRR